MSTYSEQLKDPRWQKMRLEIFERDEWTCQRCFATDLPLNAHHKYYTQGALPWQYPLDALVTYCDQCHKDVESRLYRIFERFLAELEGRMSETFDKELSRLIDCVQYILDKADYIPDPKTDRVRGGGLEQTT